MAIVSCRGVADSRGELNQRRIFRLNKALEVLLLAGMSSDAWLCSGVSGTTMFDGGRAAAGVVVVEAEPEHDKPH
jgi:hypothetical protein